MCVSMWLGECIWEEGCGDFPKPSKLSNVCVSSHQNPHLCSDTTHPIIQTHTIAINHTYVYIYIYILGTRIPLLNTIPARVACPFYTTRAPPSLYVSWWLRIEGTARRGWIGWTHASVRWVETKDALRTSVQVRQEVSCMYVCVCVWRVVSSGLGRWIVKLVWIFHACVWVLCEGICDPKDGRDALWLRVCLLGRNPDMWVGRIHFFHPLHTARRYILRADILGSSEANVNDIMCPWKLVAQPRVLPARDHMAIEKFCRRRSTLPPNYSHFRPYSELAWTRRDNGDGRYNYQRQTQRW